MAGGATANHLGVQSNWIAVVSTVIGGADAKIKAQIALTYFVERKNTEQNKCLRSCSDKIRLAMTDR